LKTPQEIWDTALGELQLQVSKPNYNTWLKDTKGIECRTDLFVIGAPNAFIAEWLENRLLSLIKKTLSGIIGSSVDVQFMIKSPVKPEVQPIIQLQTDGGISARSNRLFRNRTLNSKWTFDTFVTGESNKMAYAAAMDITHNPGHIYNPLYIYGGTGLGKSHLLHAIGNALKNNDLNIVCASAEQLTSEFVNSLKNGLTEEFNLRYRNADVLLIDDFQFFTGKAKIQQSFFHLFNELYENERQIVITCDNPPGSIDGIEDKLRSRLEGGLIADIRPPELDTRMAILQYNADKAQATISPAVLKYIAEEFHKNVRELEGSLTRVVSYARLNNVMLDLDMAMKALASLNEKSEGTKEKITPETTIHEVAKFYEMTCDMITGKKRDRKTVQARQVAMYLLREFNQCHLADIGKLFGGKDHTTVLYSCNKITGELSKNSNPELSRAVTEIQQRLNKYGNSHIQI
jgi:chromosomal replication initiator protein